MYDAGLPEPVTPQAAVMSPSSLLYSLQFRAVRVTILIAVISATMSIISGCQRIHRYVPTTASHHDCHGDCHQLLHKSPRHCRLNFASSSG